MKPHFKTVYIEVEHIKKMKDYGKVKGDQLAHEMQVVLNNEHEEGYRLQEIMPIAGASASTAAYTAGYMMFFKKIETVE